MQLDFGRLTLLLSVVWLASGLIGHQPWKADEAYSTGLVYSIAQGGSWVVPTLAGEPFMEKPPAFYLVAAGFGTLFSRWLLFHDAARLAAGWFTALTLVCVAWAARSWSGNGSAAVLALVACIGLAVHAHVLITDVGLLSGFALAYLGFALYSSSRPQLAALTLGNGVGLGFMTKGLLEPGIVGLIVIALPMVFAQWRSARYLRFALLSAAWALPWIVIWPALLWRASPELFMQWFWTNNFGRFFGFAGLGPQAPSWAYLRILPWFALPALPFAAFVCWKQRFALRHSPMLQVCVTGFLATLIVLSASHDARALYAMPLLPPLAVLAAGVSTTLSSRANAWMFASASVVYAAVAVLVWMAWLALHTGWPQPLALWLQREQPAFVPSFEAVNLTLAVLMTAAWMASLYRVRRDTHAMLFAWAAGLTLIWGLCTTLLLGWVDTGKSYRAMFDDVARNLPSPLTCLATKNLGEPQRALVHYYLHTLPRRTEREATGPCNALLIQVRLVDTRQLPAPGGEWVPRWEGARPGDEKEKFWLYSRR